MRLISNISMMFTELPVAERLSAAKEAGFEGVEIQFPDGDDIPQLAAASRRTGIPIVLINVPRGPGDAVGLAAIPGEEDAYRAAVAECARNAGALGATKVNVLSGRPPADADPNECAWVLRQNLIHTADVMQEIGVRVMVEPVNRIDVPGFFLSGLKTGLELLSDIEHSNLYLQFDFYHMAITEPDLCEAIGRAGPHIGHVQFADTSGRHEPGTGDIDFRAAIAALKATGYDAEVSAEYNPRSETQAGLDWMAQFKEFLK
ncbi:hydroxypyruvate isomerase family protein [Hoeflea prorocentri]|uniref:TIM barrel protein n=1 Tax=Hoeflea prorocentri TaxID=1922333 RepID=A0A9X3UPQ6_9HYPH|nr:TIM barrel protein [Hoeflea prorocentri]MCY6382941.1 TIM barrel protein [Hoeflea prorocentri]MDA5400741.1 TIM barrel protein [Hoeflea prorocentri]